MTQTDKQQVSRLRYTGLLFLLSFLYYALPLGQAPFFTRGEAREGMVVQAMFRQQNFILPLRNGADIPSKPPFFHWSAALLSHLQGGLSEMSIRLPSAIAASLALAAFFLFCVKSLSPKSSLLGALSLGASFEWLRSAGGARVDMMFTFWVTVATLLLFELIESYSQAIANSPNNNRSPIAFSTLALLTFAPNHRLS